jgi:hypothetical protein
MLPQAGEFLLLEVAHARAWLGPTWTHGAEVELRYGAQHFQTPVEQREDGAWISGPRPGMLIHAPMHYLFERDAGWLRLRIWVTWDVLWTSPGTPGQQALARALRTMIAQGWRPDALPSEFVLR